MSTLPKHVILKKDEERRLLSGHQWIFSNEIHRIVGDPASGDVVELLRADGKSLGIGFFNSQSLIAIRFLSSQIIPIDQQFYHDRISAALMLRQQVYPESTTYRVVHSESDFLPGLIVDRYEDYLSVQTFSTGMDQRLDIICSVLDDIFHPKGIVERNESPLRALEGIPPRSQVIRGTVEPLIVDLEGIRFTIDSTEGQKSGFFLDQRENRKSIRPFVRNKKVLDCFCNEGGFGLYASLYGASHVDSVDISETAIERARQNAAINALSNIDFHTGDVFPFLEQAAQSKKQWDVVILDPPSFTKSRKNVPAAVKGYKEINIHGLQCVAPGGFLFSASCSHHIDRTAFLNIINDSSVKAGRKIRMLRFSGASADHPVLPSMPETQYLKFVLCSVE